MVHLKYLFDASIENGALKRARILTHNNGYQSQCFEVTVYKTNTVLHLVSEDLELKIRRHLIGSANKQKTSFSLTKKNWLSAYRRFFFYSKPIEQYFIVNL